METRKIREQLKYGTIYDLPLRVTYYVRVSTDKDEQLNSLENQEAYFTEKIKACPQVDVRSRVYRRRHYRHQRCQARTLSEDDPGRQGRQVRPDSHQGGQPFRPKHRGQPDLCQSFGSKDTRSKQRRSVLNILSALQAEWLFTGPL